MTFRETLRLVARFFYTDEATIERRVDESLALVGLTDKADRHIKRFSGGEMQRLGCSGPDQPRKDLGANGLDSFQAAGQRREYGRALDPHPGADRLRSICPW